ncbi:unnamed protein product [Moneuplotes crassus]|uniref:Uncharacterized protein n=1 Tax=Euplotes crassus TaxID=5936 RepID=A0AAD1XAZ0_EUPCR|nr:unnamed protein product [Moneuplotes crassus]
MGTSNTTPTQKPPTCCSKDCKIKPLALLHTDGSYFCLRHIAGTKEEDKIEYLHSLDHQDVNLIGQVEAELVKTFKQTRNQGDHEFSDICDRVTEELEKNFMDLRKIVQDYISKPRCQNYFSNESNLGENHEDCVKSGENAIDRYFDSETLLKLAYVTQEEIGRVFIAPNENFQKDDNEIMPYSCQNKVRKTLCILYPKIQKMCSQGKDSEYFSLINPFTKLWEYSRTSQDLQQNNKEGRDILNSPKYVGKILKDKNVLSKICDHKGCSTKSFCYIPGLNCYFCINHCISPCKDTYPKLYLYNNFRKADLDIIKEIGLKVEEYTYFFKRYMKTKCDELRDKSQEHGYLYSSLVVLTIFHNINTHIKSLGDKILHASKEIRFQQRINSEIINEISNDDNNKNSLWDLLSWDEINANLNGLDLPKVQDFKQYLDPQTTIKLIFMTQAHVEDMLKLELIPYFMKNIVRACSLEVFYLIQCYYENIDSSLDSHFFILFCKAIGDFELQKDVLKYVKLLKLNSSSLNIIIILNLLSQNLLNINTYQS